ncbi:MAG TPA: efflux transporter outer membrane subunit [Ideonella sp.]|nr:efflux transporter outer membrane subunit [Ideonella sp.]
MKALATLPLCASLLLAACAVTRVEPPAPYTAAAAYKEGGLWQHAAASPATAVPDDWWTLFGDPVLDDLQRRLLTGNESLKSAVTRVASARAAVEASRAALWPTLSAGLAASRSDDGQAGSSSGSATTVRGPANSVALTASASWEIDLWGRLSQAVGGAQATLQASADDLAAARLSAQATLAQSYWSLRTAEAQQALLERSAQAYQRSLDLTQVRYDAGVAARTDVLQAQTQLKATQAQALEAAIQRAQLEHAIATLLGEPPSAVTIARSDRLPEPPGVPAMLPGSLIERRPDIAAARQRVATAYAQIGIADAAYFPSLSLSASAGYSGSSLAHLVSAPNLFWSLGPALAQTLFDGGQRRLASAQARADADQATATYRQAVLTALQEVEDNLVLADRLQAEAQLQQEALQAARHNLDITLEQYRAGTVSYLNVVVAQTSALSSENSLLGVRSRQLAAVNQLLKNIAGRWSPA